MITRDGFLSKFGRRYKVEKLPITGDEVRLRSLTAREMHEFRTSLFDRAGKVVRERFDNQDELLISLVVVDDAGRPIFSESDVAEMSQCDGGVVTWLAGRCKEWTGFRADDDWSPVVDAAKN